MTVYLAQIALQARLNNYQIPFIKFNFGIPEEAEKCLNVVNYLNFILERKTRNILGKQTRFLPDSPAHQFYCEKNTKYDGIRNAMWSLSANKTVSSPTFPFVSSSSSRIKSSSSGSSRRDKSSSRSETRRQR